ncbi:MAG: leucine-rich repeat protein [Lachnospiraceae bacterium]|nr:leucine-rich repeat protein [Lachnospiraceae bacterium]
MSALLHIPCQVVTSSEMSHAWSLIKIGGKWYHADLTWDDPLYDCIGRVYHEYFLLSDSTIGDSYHVHYSWQVKDENKQDIKAVDDTYKNYKWTDIYSGMLYKNGNWYYVKADKGGIIKDSDLSTTSKESLLVHISDEGNPAWISNGCLARIMIWQDENGQDRIYFNTPSVIKSVALNGTEERTEQTVVKAADQFIYGFVIQNNNMKYALRKNTGINEKQEVRTFGVPGISIASVAAKDYNSLDITLAKVEKAGNASGSGYVIYRRGAWETKWVTAALLEGADNCYFRDSGLGDNLQYVYIACNYQVINGDICYGPYSSEVSAVTMKAPAPQPTPAPSPSPAKDTAVKGKVYTYGNYKYKVTTLAKGKTGKVTLTAPVKKTLTKATVPSSVKIKGETYQVTAIAANAFKNNKKLKSVTIGKYVTKIGTNAFYGCQKLKTVTIKTTKLKTVGKKAFQGIVKSATIKVPKSKLAAYKKILQKKTIGLPAKAKIKKS